MSWLARIQNVFRHRRLSQELDDELAFHVAERIDDLVAGGMDKHEARRIAMRAFGNYTFQKESTRDMDIAGWLDSTVGDLRYALRQLRLNPGFTTVAVLSLALGIGANAAMFQLLDALRLRPLPVKAPSELAAVDFPPKTFVSGWYSSRNTAFTYAQYEQIQANQKAFSGMLAFGQARFNLSRGGEVHYAEAYVISPNFLNVLGVVPILGRDFTTEDDNPACGSPGVLISYPFWQREYGGDRGVLGRLISLEGRNFPVIGVTPPDFFGLEPGHRFDVAVPLCADNRFSKDGKGRMTVRHAWWLSLVGRLKPGWTLEKASQHFHEISPAVFRESLPEIYRPDAAKRYLDNKMLLVSAASGISSLREEYENPLWILLGTTTLVLLIACANLANLLLARASAREREIAVRQAMGASRFRLACQMMAESLLLATLGGVLGAFLAQALSQGLVTFLDAGDQQIYIRLGVDWRMFGFTAGLAFLTCVLFGLAPALRATRSAPSVAMHGGGRGSTSTRERNGMRKTLVVVQVALSLVLLVGALLFGRSARNLLTTPTGFQTGGLLVATVDVKLPNFNPERRGGVFQELRERISRIPGVVSTGGILMAPFSHSAWNEKVHPDSDASPTGGKEGWMNRVSPGYFQMMQTAFVAGRDFTQHDDKTAPKVAIVNEAFAKSVFGGQNPVGHTFRVEEEAGKADRVIQVVGVVKNTKYRALREDFRAIAFLPLEQSEEFPTSLSIVARTRGPLSGVMAGIREQLSQVNPGLLVEFSMLDAEMEKTALRERLMANLSGGFGLLAALLSTLGLYGILSFLVARRRNEIGVRMALGADRAAVLSLVLKDAGRLLLIGLVVGLAGSFALSRYAESLLYQLQPNDPATLAMAVALLSATALAAGFLPAHRAAHIDPIVTLREE